MGGSLSVERRSGSILGPVRESERRGSFAEFFGFVPEGGPEPTTNLFDAGFTFLSSKTVQIDMSAGLGLNDNADDWFVGAGISVRLPR